MALPRPRLRAGVPGRVPPLASRAGGVGRRPRRVAAVARAPAPPLEGARLEERAADRGARRGRRPPPGCLRPRARAVGGLVPPPHERPRAAAGAAPTARRDPRDRGL